MLFVFKNLTQFLCCKLNKSVVLRGFQSLKMPYYAVARGKAPGIFLNWSDCESQVKGFSGARYKKFNTISEAEQFINAESGSTAKSKATSSKHNVHSFSSNPNLKRAFASSASHDNDGGETSSKPKERRKHTSSSEQKSDYSDLNDDLNKQFDYIEKELNSFKKGIDKIYEKKQKKTILIDTPGDGKDIKRNSNKLNKEFITDSNGYVHVYTDGACSANGRKGARAGLGVYWGDQHHMNVSEPVSGRATNNCGEIQAATKAIKQAIDSGITKLSINTDSQFLINAVTKWIPGWKRKGWKLASGEPVKNEVDFKDLDSVQNKINVRWNYVEAHKGIRGNEMADQLAKDGAARYGLRND